MKSGSAPRLGYHRGVTRSVLLPVVFVICGRVALAQAPAPPPPVPPSVPPPVVAPLAAPPPAPKAAAPAPAAPRPPAKPPGKAAPKALAKPTPPPKKAPPLPPFYDLLFTFDDGPRTDTTPRLLDTLDKFHVKAVFFVNGVRFSGKGKGFEKAREVLLDTHRRGHLVANHTVRHKFLCGKLGPSIAEREILDNAEYIQQVIGQPPSLFRTPFGSRCPSLNALLTRLRIHPIGWDVDPEDWKLKDADKIFQFMVTTLRAVRRPRSILLFHDIHETTVDMIPRLLQWIETENVTRVAQHLPPFRIIDFTYLLATDPPGSAAPSGAG